MKRQIKFRGKRIDNGEWIIGMLVESNFNSHITIMVNTSIVGGTTEEGIQCVAPSVIPESIGQYTGMKDRYEKDIFEGDIVKWEDEYRYKEKSGISQIIWEGTEFNISGSNFGYEGEDLIGWENLEVIGNIFENADLLEKK